MRVLVTGATGYIGSHVCKLLKQHGHHVTGWDINIHGEYNDIMAYCDHYSAYDITKFVHGDFDAVVHLAGRSVVPDSLKEPTEYYRVNVMGTSNLLDRVRTPHVLFASTSSAWEMASPYARSKVAAEDVIKEKPMDTLSLDFLTYLALTGIIVNWAFLPILFVSLLWWLLRSSPTLRSLARTMILGMALAFVIIFMSLIWLVPLSTESSVDLPIRITNV